MRNLKEFIRKNWVAIFIGLVIVILIVSAILHALAPTSVTVPQAAQFTQTNFYNTTTTFQNISYNGAPIDVPTQLSVAQITTSGSITNALANIENDFQLQESNIPDIWQGPNYSLSKAPDINQYVLNLNDSDLASYSGTINKDQSVATGLTILQKYAPNSTQLQVVDNQIAYFQSGPESQPAPAAQADWISLPFSYLIDGTPIYYGNQSDLPFNLLLDAKGTLIKFTFYPLYIQVKTLSKQNTVSIDQAIKNINLGHASLVGSDSQDPNGSLIGQIKSATLKTVFLQYRIDDKTQLAYPFYQFEGDAVNATGVPITVKIITPAIQTVSQQ